MHETENPKALIEVEYLASEVLSKHSLQKHVRSLKYYGKSTYNGSIGSKPPAAVSELAFPRP